jgi:hypothetical protein
MAVITAIRWPESYDGRFDDQIVTTINLFRYLLATLAADEAPVLDRTVRDDVFIQGEREILKIMADGRVLIPPERYLGGELKARHQVP